MEPLGSGVGVRVSLDASPNPLESLLVVPRELIRRAQIRGDRIVDAARLVFEGVEELDRLVDSPREDHGHREVGSRRSVGRPLELLGEFSPLGSVERDAFHVVLNDLLGRFTEQRFANGLLDERIGGSQDRLVLDRTAVGTRAVKPNAGQHDRGELTRNHRESPKQSRPVGVSPRHVL